MASVGFTMPFSRASGSLGLFVTTTTDLAAAKADLRSLLLTNWGERPMHYDMGCNFRSILFEPIVPGITDALVDDRIRTQVAKWLPFLAVNSIQVSFPSENTIRVLMLFSLIGRPEAVDSILLEVSP